MFSFIPPHQFKTQSGDSDIVNWPDQSVKLEKYSHGQNWAPTDSYKTFSHIIPSKTQHNLKKNIMN